MVRLIAFSKKHSLTIREILVISVLVFSFTSCCDRGYVLRNKENTRQDFSFFFKDDYNSYNIAIGEISGVFEDHYTYQENPKRGHFIYKISISYNKRSAVKLNAFMLNNLDNTPIIAKYYVRTVTKASTNKLPLGVSQQELNEVYKKDSLLTKNEEKFWEFEPDSLPIILRDSGEYKAHVIDINVETNEPYSKMKDLRVYYDFEIDNKRFVSKDIRYKWSRYCDCRPKLW